MKQSIWPINQVALLGLALILSSQSFGFDFKQRGAYSEVTVLGLTTRDNGYGQSRSGTSIDAPYEKAVIEAKDDALMFVASQGEIRGAKLEQALRDIRQARTDLQTVSDEQLALEIANY